MDSRINNSIKNGTAAMACQLVSIILSFICRSVFIYILGNEFLGVNGLFSNVLSVLSLSEMGIGTAIVFNMYKAVAQNDEEKINCLMSFYAKVYKIIGLVILIVGVLCSFFIEYLIKDNIFEVRFLRMAFLLQVINNAVSYFWSYRSCILFAYQKDWICKLTSMIVLIVGNVIQIIGLLVIGNYMVYLVIQILITIMNNFTQYVIAKKMYPKVEISYKNRLPKEVLQDIVLRVKALIIHSVSSALNFGTDNIIISKFVGIIETGLYSNYSLLINTLNGLISQVLNGITASMGNLIATNDSNMVYSVFKKINFVCQWIYGFTAVGLLCCMNQFVELWIGKDNTLAFRVVLILVTNYYVLGVRQAIMITRNAGGFYVNDRKVAMIKPIINLVFSLALVQKMGIIGVFVGTFISQIVADIILFPYFLYQYFFEINVRKYYINYALSLSVNALIGIGCMIASSALGVEGWLGLIMKGILCTFVYNLAMCIIYYKSEEFGYLKNLIVNKIIKR